MYVLTGLRGSIAAKASTFKLVSVSGTGQGHAHTFLSPRKAILVQDCCPCRGQVVKAGDAILSSGAFPQGWKA